MLTAVCVAMGLLTATPSLKSESSGLPLEQAIRTSLTEYWHLDPAWNEIEILSQTLPAVRVNPGEVVVATNSAQPPESQASVRVSFPDSLGQSTTRTIQVRLNRFARALVASQPLNRETRLTQDNTKVARIRVTPGQATLLSTFDQVEGKRLRRCIGNGQALTSDMLESIPDLEPGRSVAIVCGNNFFHVSTEGTALQKGSAGDFVRVRNNNSGKVLIARVVDATSVAVEVLP